MVVGHGDAQQLIDLQKEKKKKEEQRLCCGGSP